jgi:hypothetical protein
VAGLATKAMQRGRSEEDAEAQALKVYQIDESGLS